MKSQILQEFKGEIDGVIITHQQVYYSCEYLLELINDKWKTNQLFSDDFIKWFKCYLNRASQYMTIREIEDSVAVEIDKVNNFSEIEFPEFPIMYKKRLQSGNYLS